MLVPMVVSKVGPPVPGVGKSCRKSVKKRFEAPSVLPVNKEIFVKDKVSSEKGE